MDRNTLISVIVRLCFDYEEVIDDEIRAKVESKLESPDFIENIIRTVHVKARSSKNINIKQVKLLLLELERIRLDIEYPERKM